eukprot:g3661.t1
MTTFSENVEQDTSPLQKESTDIAENFEILSGVLLPEPVPQQLTTPLQYPYNTMSRYNAYDHDSTGLLGRPACSRLPGNVSSAHPNLVSMPAVLQQQTVVYPGYRNYAIYPVPTRGSFNILERHPSELNENHGSPDQKANDSTSDDNNNPDTSPQSCTSEREICRYFLRTGTCGYGSRCRYLHPTTSQRPHLNSMGYPLREDEHSCPFYLKNGWCGFGATCKFDHPELPPLNLPVNTMMPPVLTHVSYSTVPPPYGNLPTPTGTYPVGAATPMIHQWPLPAPGFAMNVALRATRQTNHPRPYLPVGATWPIESNEGPIPIERTKCRHSVKVAHERSAGKVITTTTKDTGKRHLSPGSEDSAYSAVMGRGALLPTICMEDTKHDAFNPGSRRDESSRVCVNNS